MKSEGKLTASISFGSFVTMVRYITFGRSRSLTLGLCSGAPIGLDPLFRALATLNTSEQFNQKIQVLWNVIDTRQTGRISFEVASCQRARARAGAWQALNIRHEVSI